MERKRRQVMFLKPKHNDRSYAFFKFGVQPLANTLPNSFIPDKESTSSPQNRSPDST
jgi:hypothetical protein